MTGYGKGEASGEGFTITVELKTVNNRFLDANIRLPSEIAGLENDVKRIISERLSRGRVDMNLQYERTREVEYEINRPLIDGYLSVMRQLRDEYELEGKPDLNFIARLPNALQPAKQELSEEFAEGVFIALGGALDALTEMRETEGASLATVLEGHLSTIEEQLPLIDARSETVLEEYSERLTKKIEKLLSKSDSQIEIDQGRMAQEVAYLAEKSDIAEEVARLRSHLDQFRTIIREEGSIGKRLDFLTQELNREANTIASKTQQMEIKEAALTMKSEIEKIREQIQNVE